jgi:hypothetical protein
VATSPLVAHPPLAASPLQGYGSPSQVSARAASLDRRPLGGLPPVGARAGRPASPSPSLARTRSPSPSLARLDKESVVAAVHLAWQELAHTSEAHRCEQHTREGECKRERV